VAVGQVLRAAGVAVAAAAHHDLRPRDRLIELYSKHTGQPDERVRRDMERDYFMSAAEAKDYGLVDEVLVRKKAEPQAVQK